MKKIIYSILLFLNTAFVFSQPAIIWQKCLGGTNNEQGGIARNTQDKGCIVAGGAVSNDGDVSGNHGATNEADAWVVKLDVSRNIQWQHCYGGTGSDVFSDIQLTQDGGYVACGWTGSSDGDVTFNHGGACDIWVVKLDINGNIQWQKTYGGSMQEQDASIKVLPNGGYLVCGSTNSNDGDVSGQHDTSCVDVWILKLDISGNIIWQKCYGGTNCDFPGSIDLLPNGGFVFGASARSNDGDVTGLHIGQLLNQGDAWIVIADSSGNIIHQKCFGGTLNEEVSKILRTTDGGFIFSAYAQSVDGDVVGNHIAFPYPHEGDGWIVKTDSLLNIQWQQCLGGTRDDYAQDLIETIDSNYIALLCGMYYDGNTPFQYGIPDVWLSKISSSGNILWSQSYGGTDDEWAEHLTNSSDGKLLITAATSSNNIDVSGFHTNSGRQPDIWVAELTETPDIIKGKVFADLNGNNIQDAGELPFSNLWLYESQSQHNVISHPDGGYSFLMADTGQYTVNVQTSIPYYTSSPANHTVNFMVPNQVDSTNDFAMQPTGSFNDLKVQIFGGSGFRPGFRVKYYITYKNVGTTVMSGSVVCHLDSNLTYLASSPAPVTVSADSVVWTFNSLIPFYQDTIVMFDSLSVNADTGIYIVTPATVNPVAGDADPLNNIDTSRCRVRSSIDPNELEVNRSFILSSELSTPPYLEYVIYFQNVGNDTAFNIRIYNNISDKLDIGTLEVVDASYAVRTDYQESSRLIKFYFDQILLPDSSTDQLSSQGFIRYRIKPLSTLQTGDSILNIAAVYFDFSLPKMTNQIRTDIINATGLAKMYGNPDKIAVYPNPFSNFFYLRNSTKEKITELKIYNSFGECVLNLKGDINQIDLSNRSSGMYFYNIVTQGGKTFSGTLIKK